MQLKVPPAFPRCAMLESPFLYLTRRLQEFLLAPGYRNFNHGSFGAMPKAVWDAQKRYQEQAESRPDKWFREDYQILIESSRYSCATCLRALQCGAPD